MVINTVTNADVAENLPNASGLVTNRRYANPKIPVVHNIAHGAPKK